MHIWADVLVGVTSSLIATGIVAFFKKRNLTNHLQNKFYKIPKNSEPKDELLFTTKKQNVMNKDKVIDKENQRLIDEQKAPRNWLEHATHWAIPPILIGTGVILISSQVEFKTILGGLCLLNAIHIIYALYKAPPCYLHSDKVVYPGCWIQLLFGTVVGFSLWNINVPFSVVVLIMCAIMFGVFVKFFD